MRALKGLSLMTGALLSQSAGAFLPASRIENGLPGPKGNLQPFRFIQRHLPSPDDNDDGRRPSALHLSRSIASAPPTSMYLVRFLFLRALAFVYAVAFWVAFRQNKALIGDSGLTPARHRLDQAQENGKARRKRREEQREKRVAPAEAVAATAIEATNSNTTASTTGISKLRKVVGQARDALDRNRGYQFLRERIWDRVDNNGFVTWTLLWLAPNRNKLNRWLDGLALSGFVMSLLICILGASNVPLLFAVWLCHRSIWAVGGLWYAYGWEAQLAELGFHAMFLVPLLSLDPFAQPPVPPIVAWAIRWYLFRIMVGAGLIKMRGGSEWKDLTAMNTFYETQPVPNQFSKYFHRMPVWWHKFEVLINHFVELVAPWLLLVPFRKMRCIGGAIQIAFQSFLIMSGNLSFLNWLTAVPAILCFDDAFIGPIFFPSQHVKATMSAYTASEGAGMTLGRRLVTFAFGALVAKLSIPVVQNLISKKQMMNGSFDRLRLVNTYGAFGVVDDVREELIISSAMDVAGEWREYEFPVKPGDVTRRPRWISPYHYRLDWQMYIANKMRYVGGRNKWMLTLLVKLLDSDKEVIKSLFVEDPWGGEQPKYIRVDRYRYSFADKNLTDSGHDKAAPYWKREFMERVYPRQGVASKDSLELEIESNV